MIYRYKAILDFMNKKRKWVTPNEVADGVGMSWNTAKKDLDFLSQKGYVIKKNIGRTKFKYRFNFSMS